MGGASTQQLLLVSAADLQGVPTGCAADPFPDSLEDGDLQAEGAAAPESDGRPPQPLRQALKVRQRETRASRGNPTIWRTSPAGITTAWWIPRP